MSDSSEQDWEWDESLYAGSAAHYARGRMAYPAVLIDTIAKALRLDQSQRLLDLGCGPGGLIVPISTHVRQAVGLDPDQAMLDQAQLFADKVKATNVIFACSRAEDLAISLGNFDVVTAAQSFHWMDQQLVVTNLRNRINEGGAFVHVAATTHRGVETDEKWRCRNPHTKRLRLL